MIRQPLLTRPATPQIEQALRAGLVFDVLQQLEEIVQLLNWLEGAGVILRRVIEIGAHHGGTAAIWCTVTTDQVISIDLPDGIGGGIPLDRAQDRNVRLLRRYPNYHGVLGDSHDLTTLMRVEAIVTGPVDLLFIDGDHSLTGVTSDYEMYRRFVRPGGFIVFHDILDTPDVRSFGGEVKTFWDALPEPKTTLVAGGWGGIGVIRTPEV